MERETMSPEIEAVTTRLPEEATVDSMQNILPFGTDAGAKTSWSAWLGVFLLALIFAFAMVDRVALSVVIEPVKADLHLSDAAFGVVQGLAIALFYLI
jgi:uncharacterized integral membrane protein